MYSVRDFELAARFIERYAEMDRSGKLAKIAEMLEWACERLDANHELEGESDEDTCSRTGQTSAGGKYREHP